MNRTKETPIQTITNAIETLGHLNPHEITTLGETLNTLIYSRTMTGSGTEDLTQQIQALRACIAEYGTKSVADEPLHQPDRCVI